MKGISDILGQTASLSTATTPSALTVVTFMSQAWFFTNMCVLGVLFYICALDNSPGTRSILIPSNRKTGSSVGEPFTPCPHLESSPWSGSFLVSPRDCGTRALCVWPGLLPGAPLTSLSFSVVTRCIFKSMEISS